ncbi:class I SAM-dependent methyltransferase [Gynuella sunshinyii]|uniref:Methylase involved in ubiquinone/menaquinone biosynthesis n=1 Tax=Gynuella sunshinyii YC6258 TaxID=1445510 RepID=A0A0C5V2Q8_9GAMM|nr:class I SAM-dependent methyltransferase [Gynuella sunshinyii]AJQ93750.1 methylase involved in ubiquinone/menaquinone biosynthesis [Gynuella sunshinyii YC6258]
MSFLSAHPLQPFWNLAAAPIQATALNIALTRDVFGHLQQPTGAAEAADSLGLEPGQAEALLELLWSMGLLTRYHGTAEPLFQTSSLAQQYFMESSDHNCREAWQFRYASLQRSSQLMADQFQLSNPDDEAGHAPFTAGGSWATAARVQIGQEQSIVAAPALMQALTQLEELPTQGRFLDLGGGPGFLAIALARQFSALRGTLFDLPDTAEVAAENIRDAGLSSRICTLGGNIETDDIGSDYDLIICVSVMHFMAAPDLALKKIFQALRPGGIFVSAHALRQNDAASAAEILPFYTPMRLQGRFVPTQADWLTLLEQTGFRHNRCSEVRNTPMAPLQLSLSQR